jgi:hypothetical protein
MMASVWCLNFRKCQWSCLSEISHRQRHPPSWVLSSEDWYSGEDLGHQRRFPTYLLIHRPLSAVYCGPHLNQPYENITLLGHHCLPHLGILLLEIYVLTQVCSLLHFAGWAVIICFSLQIFQEQFRTVEISSSADLQCVICSQLCRTISSINWH